MAHRLGASENTFNAHLIIPLVERYALEHQREPGADAWVPDLFLDVGFPPETCVTIIQQIWYSNLAPFTGAGARVLASHIVRLVDGWYEECLSRNERAFGSEENAREIGELMVQVAESLPMGLERQNAEEVRRKIMRSYR